MIFKNKLIEPRPLSAEELELAALDDQIRAQERMLNILRTEWEMLGRLDRRTKEGVKLEAQVANLDVKIIGLKMKYEKKREKYGLSIPVSRPQDTASMNIGRVLCVLTIIGLVVCGIILGR